MIPDDSDYLYESSVKFFFGAEYIASGFIMPLWRFHGVLVEICIQIYIVKIKRKTKCTDER